MNKSESKYFNTAVKFDKALLSLLEKKPFEYITISEICEKAGVNRSTFYLHYQDQFELLADIEKDVLENTEKALGNFDGSLNTKEGIAVFLEYLKKNKETFGVLLCQQDSEDFQKTIIKHIEKNVKASVPEMLDYKNADYAFTFVMYGSFNVLKAWIQRDFDTPVNELSELIYTLCNNIVK